MARNIAIIVGVFALVLIVWGAVEQWKWERSGRPRIGPDPAPRVEGPPAQQCRNAGQVLATFIGRNPGTASNPEPGKLYIPAGMWALAQKADRETIVQVLAIQKGCSLRVDPMFVDVEVRSVSDARLIASGTPWNFKDR